LKFKIKDELVNLETYKPGKPINEVKRELGLKKVIKLASNENPIGPSKNVIRALKKAVNEVNRYPDSGCYYLRKKIARKLKVNEEQIIFGNGSDELIIFAIRALLDKGDEIIIANPTFLIYNIASKAAGLKIKKVPLKSYKYDLEGMAAAITHQTRMLFIANPDNPTGTYNSVNEVDKFLDELPEDVMIFFDEAYFEYAQYTTQDYPNSMNYHKRGNIITTRTFSKAYGLAGLRIGYAISEPDIIDLMSKVREPFNINLLAQVAAEEALDDEKHVESIIQMTDEGKKYLYKELSRLGIEYIPSATNFILIKLEKQAELITKKMVQQGVVTRYMGAWGLHNHIRVTIGTKDENERFLELLTKLIH
jgi:histidinol-phosphate aminotransferase